jgi:hypothetical protein
LNFEAATSKVCRPQYDKQFQSSDLFDYFIVPQRLNLVIIEKRKISKSNKFSRLAAKLSEMIAKFRGRSLKLQPRLSFDLNGLKNGLPKYF